jgi:membrane protein DedA with SNARE-associated domain
MVVNINRRAVGVFSSRRDAEAALQELRDTGFPMDRVSVVLRNAEGEDEIAGAEVTERIGNKADESSAVGAASGGVLGGLTGLLIGLGTLAIPGIGPIMLAGAAATALATTLAGAGIGAVAGGFLGALIGLGIPEERARIYNERVRRGHYLVMVDGTETEIATAEEILRRRGIEELDVYDAPSRGDGIATRYAIGYFSRWEDVQAAIAQLRANGFPLNQICLIHRSSADVRQKVFPGVIVGDRLEDLNLGLQQHRFHFYNERIHHGDYVVAVRGKDADIDRAAAILSGHGIQGWEVYDPIAVSTSTSHTTKTAVGAFSHRRGVEAALSELRDAGFPMDQVSLIGKHGNDSDQIAGVDRNVGVGNQADEGAKAGAVTGAALGGLGGLLVGLGTLAIPGVGPVIAGGAIATALATTVTGGAAGAAAGSLVGALVGLGIPENRARVYSDRFHKGDYLVAVNGTDEQIRRAEAILKRWGIEDFDIFDARVRQVTQEDAKVTIVDRRNETI